MAVAFNNAQFNNQTAAQTTNSFSYDAGTGDNRVLVLHVTTTASELSDSCTYGGVSMTKATSDNTSRLSEIYYLANPSSGSNTVLLTFPTTQQSLINIAYASGAETGQPIGVAKSSVGGTTTTPQVTMTTDSSNSGIFIGVGSQNGSPSDLAGQTTLTTNDGWVNQDNITSYEIEATAGSHTYGYTQSSVDGCCSAVEIREPIRARTKVTRTLIY